MKLRVPESSWVVPDLEVRPACPLARLRDCQTPPSPVSTVLYGSPKVLSETVFQLQGLPPDNRPSLLRHPTSTPVPSAVGTLEREFHRVQASRCVPSVLPPDLPRPLVPNGQPPDSRFLSADSAVLVVEVLSEVRWMGRSVSPGGGGVGEWDFLPTWN